MIGRIARLTATAIAGLLSHIHIASLEDDGDVVLVCMDDGSVVAVENCDGVVGADGYHIGTLWLSRADWNGPADNYLTHIGVTVADGRLTLGANR